jgi:excisionase family DNA binding protein
VKDIDTAAGYAIQLAKLRNADEVSPDDVLLGCLWARSRFGVAKIGPWTFDLEPLGVPWVGAAEKSESKVSYSPAVVGLFDLAARIARSEGTTVVNLEHLLVAFASEASGLMGKLKSNHRFDGAAWRSAVADLEPLRREEAAIRVEGASRDYLTPEEAAAALNIHVQTLRAYVRSGKLPARRLAGERAIRIRRTDLEQVLEPFAAET